MLKLKEGNKTLNDILQIAQELTAAKMENTEADEKSKADQILNNLQNL